MKIWEVFKKLEENPSKKFQRKSGKRTYTLSVEKQNYITFIAINDNGVDLVERYPHGAGGFGGNFRINDEWEEVKQPVTWQEALEAWANGKSLRLLIDDKEHYLAPSKFIIAQEDIEKGKWYIND